MKLGLHIPDYTWPGGPDSLGHDLAQCQFRGVKFIQSQPGGGE